MQLTARTRGPVDFWGPRGLHSSKWATMRNQISELTRLSCLWEWLRSAGCGVARGLGSEPSTALHAPKGFASSALIKLLGTIIGHLGQKQVARRAAGRLCLGTGHCGPSARSESSSLGGWMGRAVGAVRYPLPAYRLTGHGHGGGLNVSTRWEELGVTLL
jgi:hypothetical protein